MFTRVSNTRMKGSTVFQGLKTWPWKIHQQLPLSGRESQRLLGALTSTFQHHLDKAHPPTAPEDHRPKATGEEKQTGLDMRGLHSSAAAAADKHLSSILTNPLLAKTASGVKKADQDYARAMMELQKQHAQDPITLLEKYYVDGTATIPIAHLCLRKFDESLSGLSESDVQQTIADTEAGRRVLSWLLKSGQYEQAEFVDNGPFIELLVQYMLKEGREHLVWDWIKLDMALADDGRFREYPESDDRKLYYAYRWKGQVLRAVVLQKLGTPNRELQTADEALDAFFKACELKASAQSRGNMSLPLAHAGGLLNRAFTKDISGPFKRTSCEKYERYVDLTDFWYEGDTLRGMLTRGKLGIAHPYKKTAIPFLAAFRTIFAENPSEYTKKIRITITHPRTKEARDNWYIWMLHAVILLREQGRPQDADWMLNLVQQIFEDRVPYIQRNLRDLVKSESLKRDAQPDAHPAAEEGASSMPPRLPFPSFT